MASRIYILSLACVYFKKKKPEIRVHSTPPHGVLIIPETVTDSNNNINSKNKNRSVNSAT